jgi:fucose 4-O-acetylase-like acetyltransferase
MRTNTVPEASALARITPASRDRYVDFLRLVSICVVMLGHLLMAVVIWRGNTFRVANVIEMTPGLWLATWAFQVMPIFFFVGGFANAVTIDSFERSGRGAPEFVASRVDRLLRPVAVLLGVWVAVTLMLEVAGVDRRVLGDATRLVCQPLWFIGVYLGVTSLAPCMRRLHDRHPYGAILGLLACTAIVDTCRFGLHLESLGYLNVLFVWLFAQQAGFFYADGSLARVRREHLAFAAIGALVTLGLLTMFGPYPRSMVGLPGDRVSNMSPPTLCLAVLTVFQVAAVMWFRPHAQRLLARPGAWTAVIAGNGVIMTLFLWHLTAAIVALAVLHWLGAPQPAPASALWWLSRPVWIACALAPLVVLVALLGRFERPRPAHHRARGDLSPAAVGVGVALLCVAVLGIASTDIPNLVADIPIRLAVVTVAPAQLLLMTLGGFVLMRRAVSSELALVDGEEVSGVVAEKPLA